MPNYTTNVNIYSWTDAAFRAFGSAISNIFLNLGFVKTADTGQVDWVTVVRPSTNNTTTVYEVWRFDDALQSTTPIFFRIGYGFNNLSLNGYATIEVGSGSNGSGVITGQGAGIVNGLSPINNTSGDNSSRAYYASGDGSGFCIAGGPESLAASRYVFVLDRLRNSDGTPNSYGAVLISKLGGATITGSYIYDRVNNASIPNGAAALFPCVMVGTTSQQANGAIPFGPYWALIQNVGVFRSKLLLCVSCYEIGLNGNIFVNFLGATRKFKSLGAYYANADGMAQTQVSFAVWWSD